jgi:hypothetical protein
MSPEKDGKGNWSPSPSMMRPTQAHPVRSSESLKPLLTCGNSQHFLASETSEQGGFLTAMGSEEREKSSLSGKKKKQYKQKYKDWGAKIQRLGSSTTPVRTSDVGKIHVRC